MSPFVKTRRVLQVMSMARMYKCRPSEILSISEDYAAYCFDEACAFIQCKIDNGEEPQERKHYSSFSDIYKGLEKGGVKCQ